MADPVTPPAAGEPPAAPPPVPPAPPAPPAAPPAPPAPPVPPAAPPAAAPPPPAGDPGKDGAPPEPPKAPAVYQLAVPAGAEPLFEADDLAEIEAYARKNDLTQDEAQAGLVEMANARVATLAKLDAQLKADVDYGGTKLSETQRLVKTVVDRVRPADHPRRAAFERMMARSGAGNHIEAVSFLADLGRMMAEDQPHLGGGGGGGAARPAAEVLYGDKK